jgi:hypothetical protein
LLFDVIKDSFIRMESARPALQAGRVLALYLFVIIMIFMIAGVVWLSVKKRMLPFAGMFAVILAAPVILLCIYYPDVNLLYAHPSGDPAVTVNFFLTAVSEGRMNDGYDILYGRTETGAVQSVGAFSGAQMSTPLQVDSSYSNGNSVIFSDDVQALYYRYLTDNFSYEFLGDVTVTDLRASVPVRIYYADLSAAPDRVDTLFEDELDSLVQSNARKDVYNSDDSYQSWVIEDAYDSALRSVLMSAPVKVSRDVEIRLYYEGGKWNIEPSDELLQILGGCVCGMPSTEKNLVDNIGLFANNIKSDILADLVYIPKLYSIPEDAIAGYEPCDEKYHELTDPNLIYEVAAESEHLIRGADLVFDPNVTFATNQKMYYYADDSIFVVCWKEFLNECYCNFAEVFISDPSQFRRKIAGDTYGYSAQMYASSLAAEANAVVAMNGDFYKFRSPGICVYNRVVYRCEGNYLDTCFVDAKGNLIFSYAGELTTKEDAQRFVDENDILFSLAFGPVLIDNGVPKENLNYRIGETMQRYSRSAIGQLGEGHYLIMTIGHVYPYRECCTLRGAQDIMMLKGCLNAYTLDGGQTAEVIWRDKPYSYVDWGVERTVSDIIYFATAVPEDEQ